MRIELSENQRFISRPLEDVKRNFFDMIDRLENGVSNDTALYCGEIELRLVNNRNDDGSPFTFVSIDETS